MDTYTGYIKCGEIFKPPQLSKNPYLLRCIQCEDIFKLLESFVMHLDMCCTQIEIDVKEEATSPLESEIDEESKSMENDCESRGSWLDNENQEQNTCSSKISFDPLTLLKSEHSDNEETFQLEIEVANISNVADIDSHELVEEVVFEEDMSDNSEAESIENDASEMDEEYLPTANYTNKRQKQDLTYVPKKRAEIESMTQKFMNKPAQVIALIDAYKAQTMLWHKRTKEPLRHKNYRQQCLEAMTAMLNDQFDLSFDWRDVAKLTTHICRRFREDLKKLKECEGSGQEFEPSWFFERMQFLQPFVENNYIGKIAPNLPNLLPHQVMDICDIYKSFPHLWNTQLLEYRCRLKRQQAEQQMVQAIEAKLKYKIHVSRLTKYLKYLHLYFSHAKRKRMDNLDVENEESNDYYGHMCFLYDHVGPFRCHDCSYETQSWFKLKLHTSQHDGTMPFKCVKCAKEFSSIGSYDIHARRHMDDFRDVCKECGRKFMNSKDLEIHMRTHTEVMPYCCEVCGVSFRHIQTLNNHKRRHAKQYLHSCEICSKGFYTKAKLRDHMKTHTNIRDCICKTCGKAFKTMNSLRTHEITHSDIRKYVCSICGKSFKLTNGLKQHMRTHGTKLGEERAEGAGRNK